MRDIYRLFTPCLVEVQKTKSSPLWSTRNIKLQSTSQQLVNPTRTSRAHTSWTGASWTHAGWMYSRSKRHLASFSNRSPEPFPPSARGSSCIRPRPLLCIPRYAVYG
ncbi:hypothetical protein NA56DRAFT_491846 [Hyaloscypha hepaticicola]|uniref:Uncharacterized protein n=1 Tax=Hyaloscypha hepaticicola TaxID=2082293 RepID=A0A2J6QE87_9HELO|nr:hypothetical protein NA56DRAFT_491846 [Hyaloscypha hepaticicola]